MVGARGRSQVERDVVYISISVGCQPAGSKQNGVILRKLASLAPLSGLDEQDECTGDIRPVFMLVVPPELCELNHRQVKLHHSQLAFDLHSGPTLALQFGRQHVPHTE
jgi:hypothetical protein